MTELIKIKSFFPTSGPFATIPIPRPLISSLFCYRLVYITMADIFFPKTAGGRPKLCHKGVFRAKGKV